jgi:hypothetical protein
VSDTLHTTGPWRIGNTGEAPHNLWHILGAGDLMKVATVESYPSRTVGLADAKLIAAAPELLVALKVLVEHALETHPHFESERGKRDILAAIVAVTKATGGSQ